MGPGPDHLEIDRAAPVGHLALDHTSWVDLVPGFVPDHRRALDHVLGAVAFEQWEVLRYDRYVPERRLGGSVRADRLPVLRQTQLHLEATYRVRFDGVTAIQYRDGSDFQGLHADREMRWLDDTLIAILVLGARRPFVLRPRAPWASGTVARPPAGSLEGDVVLTPGEGDLLVMGGRCQRDWLHGVPVCDPVEVADVRVSLAWRWTSRRGRPDTAPTYFDGRRFSDRPGGRGLRRSPAP